MRRSQFDQFRFLAQQALNYSREWLSDPLDVSLKFSDRMIGHGLGRANIANAPDAIQRSLYLNALLSGRWAMSGLPTITLGHKTAAAFCATKMRPEDAKDYVRSPWPAFAVRLPDNLLFVEDEGVQRSAELLIASAIPFEQMKGALENPELTAFPDEDRWWFKLCSPSFVRRPDWMDPEVAGFFDGISLWGFNMPTSQLAEPDGGESTAGYTRWETHHTEASDKRSERMARSLLLACCMYLSGDPRERAERASEEGVTIKERKSKKRDGDELPQYTSFEVTSSIHINLHSAVRDFVERGGSAPTVQTMVAGHWKRVPCGPRGANRKLVHIKPYWRGDLDAPISTRSK